jgi:hypothetical protein
MSRRASDPAAPREPPSPAAAIRRWRPRGLGSRGAAFCREAVAAAEPESAARARALLYAASKLARFGESVGLEPEAETLLGEATIERFVLLGTHTVSAATRRTLRTNLRALARAQEADPRPLAAALPRERAKAPYGEAEIAGYLHLAQAQPTEARRMRAGALLCLGAGAGLIGSELRHVSGRDVTRRCGGLLVAVGGRRARAVPVLARFGAPLEEAARFAGDRLILGGCDPERRNLTDGLNAALSRDAGLPRLQPARLRATWLCECAELIGLQAFMKAAGIRCSQRLGDLAAELPEVDEPAAVALLGGAGGGQGPA